MREYVNKDVLNGWFGGDYFRRIRKTSYARSYAQHPVEEKILDYLEPVLVLFVLLAGIGAYQLSYSGVPMFFSPNGDHSEAGMVMESLANALLITLTAMFIAWILYHIIPRMMGYRRVPKWELHAERRAQWLATLDEKERARYLLEEDARDQAYRRGVATGYVAGRNSGRWYY